MSRRSSSNSTDDTELESPGPATFTWGSPPSLVVLPAILFSCARGLYGLKKAIHQDFSRRPSLSHTTSILLIARRLPTASRIQTAQATGQKKSSQRYSHRQVTMTMVPMRQFRQSMIAARLTIKQSSAMRTAVVRRRRGATVREKASLNPRPGSGACGRGRPRELLAESVCLWSLAKRLLGRPTPKRQVQRARVGERNARRMSSDGSAPG